MEILRVDATLAERIGPPTTRVKGTSSIKLAEGEGEAHAHILDFEPGGEIGPHEAGFGQLFFAVTGDGCYTDPWASRIAFAPARGSAKPTTRVLLIVDPADVLAHDAELLRSVSRLARAGPPNVLSPIDASRRVRWSKSAHESPRWDPANVWVLRIRMCASAHGTGAGSTPYADRSLDETAGSAPA